MLTKKEENEALYLNTLKKSCLIVIILNMNNKINKLEYCLEDIKNTLKDYDK